MTKGNLNALLLVLVLFPFRGQHTGYCAAYIIIHILYSIVRENTASYIYTVVLAQLDVHPT